MSGVDRQTVTGDNGTQKAGCVVVGPQDLLVTRGSA